MNLFTNNCRLTAGKRLIIIIWILFQTIFVQGRQSPISFLKKCWEKTVVAKNNEIASDNQGNFYLLTSDHKIQSFRVENGEINWVYEIGGRNFSNIVLTDKELFIAHTAENKIREEKIGNDKKIYLRSLNTLSGIPLWATEVDLSGVKTNVQTNLRKSADQENGKMFLHLYQDDLVLLDSSGNFIYADKKHGTLKMLSKIDSIPRLFFDFDNFSLFRNDAGEKVKFPPPVFAFQSLEHIYLLDAPTGRIVFQIENPAALTAGLLIDQNNVLIGDDKGKISLLRVVGKGKIDESWRVKIGASVTGIARSSNGILATSLDNFVYLLDFQTGKKIWKKRLSGRLLFKPLILEKEKFLIVVENDTAYLINLENGKIADRIAAPADEYFTNSPFMINGQYIFQTNTRLISFSDSGKGCATALTDNLSGKNASSKTISH